MLTLYRVEYRKRSRTGEAPRPWAPLAPGVYTAADAARRLADAWREVGRPEWEFRTTEVRQPYAPHA